MIITIMEILYSLYNRASMYKGGTRYGNSGTSDQPLLWVTVNPSYLWEDSQQPPSNPQPIAIICVRNLILWHFKILFSDAIPHIPYVQVSFLTITCHQGTR